MEPDRQIEKILRAAAKKRRDQAGDTLELRPSVREQLQREVSRNAAAKSGGGFIGFFSKWFSGFTPKLAFGVSVLGIVALAAWLLLPGLVGKQKESTLAMNEKSLGKAAPAARREIAARPAPVVAEDDLKSAPVAQISPPASAAAPAHVPLPPEPGADRKHSVAANDKFKQTASTSGSIAQNSPAPATQAASVPSENPPATLYDATPPSGSLAGAPNLHKNVRVNTVIAAPANVATNGVVSGATIAAAAPEAQKKLDVPQPQVFYRANPAAVAADNIAGFGIASSTASNSQRFRRTVPAGTPHSVGTSRPSPVLTAFQVVQNGQKIRVVDADGSIYIGSFTTADQIPPSLANSVASRFATTEIAPAAAPAAKAVTPKEYPQTYIFRVAGTNLNLNQNVVFSGNLIPLANIPQVQTGAALDGGAAGPGRQIPAPLLLSNSRIAGKAIIGGKKEIEVNATPAPAP